MGSDLSLSLSLSLHLCAEESEARCNYPGELQVSCYHTDSNQWTNSPVNSNATSLYVTAVGITVVTTPLVDEMHLCAATFICPHDRRKKKSQEDWSGSKLSFPFVEKHKGLIHLLFFMTVIYLAYQLFQHKTNAHKNHAVFNWPLATTLRCRFSVYIYILLTYSWA